MQEILQRKAGRIEVIDVLRSFTLLGIALVHFPEQYYAGMMPQSFRDVLDHSLADKIVSTFVGIFISGKFFMIFSFLFGFSFFLQLNKSDGSIKFVVRFMWRLVVLFMIGVVHQLHYRGDILTIYAVLGFGLLLTYKLPDKILLVLALLLVFNVPSLVTRAMEAIQPAKATTESFFNQDPKTIETYYNTVKSGSYTSILEANLYEMKGKLDFQVESGRIYITMGLFMLGLYAGRKNMFEDAGFFKRLIRYALWALLGSVLLFLTILGGIQLAGITVSQPVQWLVGGGLMDVFNACLASIYVGLIFTLFQKDKWRARLMVFYSVGRMGLTTYLMQALAGFFIFFSMGFALVGELGAFVSFFIGIGIFALQIIFSNYWLKYFQYGPAEWVWRSLTYFKLQPLRQPNMVDDLDKV